MSQKVKLAANGLLCAFLDAINVHEVPLVTFKSIQQFYLHLVIVTVFDGTMTLYVTHFCVKAKKFFK